MGLDDIELLMSVEETFDIKITDEDATECSTVGRMYQCVKKQIESIEIPVKDIPIEYDDVWDRFTTLISEELRVNKDELKAETDFYKDLGLG